MACWWYNLAFASQSPPAFPDAAAPQRPRPLPATPAAPHNHRKTRKSTQCCLSACCRAFSMSFNSRMFKVALCFRSSSRTARFSSTCKTLFSHRHAWTAFDFPCCSRCTPRRTETSWSGFHSGLSPALFSGPVRRATFARAPLSASTGRRSRSAFG